MCVVLGTQHNLSWLPPTPPACHIKYIIWHLQVWQKNFSFVTCSHCAWARIQNVLTAIDSWTLCQLFCDAMPSCYHVTMLLHSLVDVAPQKAQLCCAILAKNKQQEENLRNVQKNTPQRSCWSTLWFSKIAGFRRLLGLTQRI